MQKKLFKIHSKFSPTGDQPEAIDRLSENIRKNVKHQTLWGVTGSGKTFTIANVIEKVQRPTLVIAHNKTLAAQLADEFRQFFPDNAVHYFVSYYDYYQPEAYIPHSDTYIEKDSSINDEIDRLRHAATHALLTRSDVIIVASVSCIYGIGSPEFYQAENFTFRVGESIKRDYFLHQLNNLQFNRNDVELKRGTYRLSGDTLEIFPAYENNTIRVEFFGNEVEKISEIDWITGKQLGELDSFEVFPAKHFITPESLQKEAIKNIKKDLEIRTQELKKQNKLLEAQRIEQRTNFDLEMIEQTGYCSGIENYSRYFDGRKKGEPSTTLIDYFPKDFLLAIDESHITVSQIGAMYAGDRSRKEKLVDYGFRLPSAFDNRPLRFDEFYNKINQMIFTTATPGEFELYHSAKENIVNGKKQPYDAVVKQFIRPTGLLDPIIEVRKTKGQIDNLIEEINKRVEKHQRVLITTLTKKMAEALTDHLLDKKIKVAYIHSDIETLERTEILHSLRLGEYDVLIGINLLREGLDLPEVSLVAILDADKEGFLRSKTSLVQTIGRAARHLEGKVIMYADVITDSMRNAIDETNARREVQEKYNKEHNITPKSAERTLKPKEIKEEKEQLEIDLSFKKLPKIEKKKVISDLNHQMKMAAEKLEFEHAARLRDQVTKLESML
ncbi:MAG: excinuclease ABC subunit UvrB [Patescibacteria group bacterium]|nr:excinuclease ABC subunit UvrB [Patescibacteria group bacterium]